MWSRAQQRPTRLDHPLCSTRAVWRNSTERVVGTLRSEQELGSPPKSGAAESERGSMGINWIDIDPGDGPSTCVYMYVDVDGVIAMPHTHTKMTRDSTRGVDGSAAAASCCVGFCPTPRQQKEQRQTLRWPYTLPLYRLLEVNPS
jgi:hypothetical protein